MESIYEEALAWGLTTRRLRVERQKEIPIHYKGTWLATPLRLDPLVEGRVIVECKAAATYHSIFESQALTYLRLLDLRLALVINLGERYVRDGVHRVVNGL